MERKESIVTKFKNAIELFIKNSKNLTYINSEAEVIIEEDNILIQTNYNIFKVKNVIIASRS